jgi:hypothetical protein
MNFYPDVPTLSLSIGPYDTWQALDSMPASEFRRLRCFVVCRFDRAGTMKPLIQMAASNAEIIINHEIQVYYAGDFVGSSAIHPEIWTHILQADIIVADTTGYNPNVMYELGVAAAWRLQSSIIIIHDEYDRQASAFDLQPARQIVYNSSEVDWMDRLITKLTQNMVTGLASVPFQHEPNVGIPASFEVDLTDGKDTEYLWSPGPGHRRLIDGGLEFGSPFYFPYSWLSPPKLRPSNVEVEAEMRFTFRIDSCWIGIALRSQGYLAGNSYLAWLGQDGKVHRTGPNLDAQGKDEHHDLGNLAGFDPARDLYIPFRVSINSQHWKISVEDIDFSIPVSELPHVFPYGRVMIQSYRCRAAIRNVKITSSENQ